MLIVFSVFGGKVEKETERKREMKNRRNDFIEEQMNKELIQ